MNRLLVVLSVACLLVGCRQTEKGKSPNFWAGAWTLTKIDYPVGVTFEYPNNGVTFCRIYMPDSVFYECHLRAMWHDDTRRINEAADVSVVPSGRMTYAAIYKGGGEWVYMEEGNLAPVTIVDDTAMVIQRNGVKYSWRRAVDMPQERVDEIRQIIMGDEELGEGVRHYVLPTTERELKEANSRLLYLIVILMLVVVLVTHVAWGIYKKKKDVERMLRQIKEERDHRPHPLSHAMKEVEGDFFQSDDYLRWQRRCAAGERMSKEDWELMEKRLNQVYPGFSNHLFGLCRMSDVEFQVCMLVKLHVAPSAMAAVLSRDISSISSIRRRLYAKVFQQKGSSKDWDDFILML